MREQQKQIVVNICVCSPVVTNFYRLKLRFPLFVFLFTFHLLLLRDFFFILSSYRLVSESNEKPGTSQGYSRLIHFNNLPRIGVNVDYVMKLGVKYYTIVGSTKKKPIHRLSENCEELYNQFNIHKFKHLRLLFLLGGGGGKRSVNV